MKSRSYSLYFFITLISMLASCCRVSAEEVERYTVTAERPYYSDTLDSIFPQYRYQKSNLVSPVHINDILLQSPSVNLNGQGGQIQNINIRGFSRWRIQSLLDGVPILSDRRAGASVGFVAPAFIQGVTVIPGATSTYLGSGAIGGAVNLLFPYHVEPSLQIGWASNQHGQDYSYADYDGNTDWHVSYRHANKGSDAQGNTLFDKFEQTAVFMRHRPESGVLEEAWTLYSNNTDIGKSSSDFPLSRITTYPKNTHWLGKMKFGLSDVVGNLWWHQSQLDTHILRPAQRINDTENKAFDYGFDIGSKARLDAWLLNWQVQLMGREGVIVDEREFSLLPSIASSDGESTEQIFAPELAFELRTLEATETTAAGIVDASRKFGNTSVALGARLDWQQQSDASGDVSASATDSLSNTNGSGFVGASRKLTPQLMASVYLSSAFRNPSLTERFFSGETPRGTVLGDRRLDTERATNLQASLLYDSEEISGSVEVFRQHINHYIERISVSDEVLQYSNLDSATIRGISYQLQWEQQPQRSLHTTQGQWHVQLSGAWIDGEDNQGNPIADIPPNHQRLNLGYKTAKTRFFSTLVYRASKKDMADGERMLANVLTLDIGAAWQLGQRTSFQASWRNLTNQQYYVSADDKAAFAQGKSVQLALTFLL